VNPNKFQAVTNAWHQLYVERQQTVRAHKILCRGLVILGIIWLLGIGVMIYVGETTLWATEETKAGFPTLEVRP
jgi:hypothetical protein